MKALIEVVELKVMDVITTSGQKGDTCPDYFCEDE